jgi:DNA repair exonuclease SbcCD ATPase subunit
MFPNIFSQIVFYSLVSDWLLRLFKSSEISESPNNSVVSETEHHRKQKQNCHAQFANPKVSEETRNPKSSEVESAKGGVPNLVQPEGTKADNASRLKRKLQSVTLSRDKLITENLLLKEKMSSMERAHADEIQSMKWYQEDMETGFADAKLQQEFETKQVLAQYRKENSQLRELNCQLINENQDLGAQLVKTQNSFKSANVSLERREHTIDSLVKKIIDLNRSCETTKSRFRHLHRRFRGVYTARSDLHRKNENLNEQVARLEEAVGKEVATRVEMEQVHSNQLNLLRNFHAQFRKNRDDHNQQLKDKLNQLEDEKITIKREVVHANRSNRQLSRWIIWMLHQVENHYSTDIKILNEKIKHLEEWNDQLMAEVDQLEVHYHNLPDYYTMINSKPTATPYELRRAFRQKLLSIHPDKVDTSLPEDIRQRIVEKSNKLSKILTVGKDLLAIPELKYEYDKWVNMSDFKLLKATLGDYDTATDPYHF